MRASRAASATMTTLRSGLEASMRRSQAPRPSLRSASVSSELRAQWTSSVRRYWFPLLLIPPSLCLPPLECSRGVRPSQAARSRPRSKAFPLPIAATRAVAVCGPIPGTSSSRRQASLAFASAASSSSMSRIRLSSSSPSVHSTATKVRSRRPRGSRAASTPACAGPAERWSRARAGSPVAG